MSTANPGHRSIGIRLLHAVSGKEPEWSTLSPEDLATLAARVNRTRSSRFARVITGRPDRRATARWRTLALGDRTVSVRVYEPRRSPVGVRADDTTPPSALVADGAPEKTERLYGAGLPLIVHVHGGGFVGTATQSDWVNSCLAARLPAVVVSVEHRLLAPATTLADIVEETWDVFEHLLAHGPEWHIDPRRVAVFGESTGGAAAALVAIRARDAGIRLSAQVLTNPCVDLTATMFDGASVTTYADCPTLTRPQMEFFAGLAVPAGSDPRAVSPLVADDLSQLAPALIVIPTADPLSDQARAYAGRLREAGTSVEVSEHDGAPHAFLSMPGILPQARPARAAVLAFLKARLAPSR